MNYNNQILNLWEEHYPPGVDTWMPLFYPEIPKHQVLFVGINPSFSESGFQRLARNLDPNQFPNFDHKTYFHWNRKDEFNIEESLIIERQAAQDASYFRNIHILADEYYHNSPNKPEPSFAHVDLFFIRETNQNEVKNTIFCNASTLELNAFGEQQFNLSWKMIIDSEPTVICVVNALASDLIKKYRTISPINEEYGFEALSLENDRVIPILFSGMVSGQRALDKGNFEYFKWRMRQAFRFHCVGTK